MDSGLVSPSAWRLARRDRKKARGSFMRVLRRDSRAGLFLRSGLSATASRNRLTASIACFSRSSARDRCLSSRVLDDLSWVLAWSSLPLAERRSAFALACTTKIPGGPPAPRQHDRRRDRGNGWLPLAPEPRPLGRPDPARSDRARVEPATQVVGQRLCRRVPPPRVLRQALQADRLEIARNVRIVI